MTSTRPAGTGLAPTSDRGEVTAFGCPVCGHSEWIADGTVRRATLSRCGQCGLLATTALLNERAPLAQLYEVADSEFEAYRAHYLPSRLQSYRAALPQLEKFRVTGRLLEIGSGYGYFLELASAAGWDAQGVEISDYACRVARSRGCKVQACALTDAEFDKKEFDVIVMWDVIEHFARPADIVGHCLELLRPGGALVMKTPDARALVPAAGILRWIYRNFVYPANTPEHVYHFTPEQLAALSRRMGAAQVAVETDDAWEERVISGNNAVVRAVRWLTMKHAHAHRWPYEFVLTAIR